MLNLENSLLRKERRRRKLIFKMKNKCSHDCACEDSSTCECKHGDLNNQNNKGCCGHCNCGNDMGKMKNINHIQLNKIKSKK